MSVSRVSLDDIRPAPPHSATVRESATTIPPTNFARKASSIIRNADMDIESVPDVLNGGAGGDDLLGLGSAAEVDKLLMKSPVSPGKCFF